MSRRVVANLWSGVRVIRVLADAEPDPPPAELAAVAAAMTAHNDGVRPVVRVLEASTVPTTLRGTAGGVTP